MLDLRNAPIDGENSPANVLMSRNLRSLLPQVNKKIQPKLYNKRRFDRFIDNTQRKQKMYFDRKGTKKLDELENNCLVNVQLKPKSQWQSAKVVKKVGIRSYKILLKNGRSYIRNRKYIRRQSTQPFFNKVLGDRTRTVENSVNLQNYRVIRVESDETENHVENSQNVEIPSCSNQSFSSGHLEKTGGSNRDMDNNVIVLDNDSSVTTDDSSRENENDELLIEHESSSLSSVSSYFNFSLFNREYETRSGRKVKVPEKYKS